MKIVINILIVLFALISFMCGGDSHGKITIENAWVRNSSQGMNTAFFFDIKNEGVKDTLFKVESNAAELVQIHETYEDGDMMGMREVENVPIKSNSTFSFKPHSHHIMLINLKKDLSADDEVEFTLHFSNAGEMKVKAKVVQK